MKFDWDPEKNEWLKRERNISFEELALLLAAGRLWRTTEHPNQEKYPNQRVFLVPMDGYIYFVPYAINAESILLKTAFPHRKATRDYLQEKNEND